MKILKRIILKLFIRMDSLKQDSFSVDNPGLFFCPDMAFYAGS